MFGRVTSRVRSEIPVPLLISRFSGIISYLHRLGPPPTRSHWLERHRFTSRQFFTRHLLVHSCSSKWTRVLYSVRRTRTLMFIEADLRITTSLLWDPPMLLRPYFSSRRCFHPPDPTILSGDLPFASLIGSMSHSGISRW